MENHILCTRTSRARKVNNCNLRNGNFIVKNHTGDKEHHYVLCKETIQQKEIIFINLCATSTGRTYSSRNTKIIIVDCLDTVLSQRDRSTKNKETLAHNMFKCEDLIDINRILPCATKECTFLQHKIRFSKIDHILDHKTYLNKYKNLKLPRVCYQLCSAF